MDKDLQTQMVLEIIFGMTQASLLAYLWFCIQILINALTRMDNARVRHPDAEKCEYQEAVQECHPSLENDWCKIHGMKLLLECSSDNNDCYYNGWTCNHYISAVLVFYPNRTI